jgi:L-fuculose-phosphate aldolase
MWQEISKFSKKLFDKGYMVSHSGNLSIRCGDRMFIKRRGAACDEIGPEDVIETGIDEDTSSIALSSSETDVHRAIYNSTSALAIVHAHPPYSIVCSLLNDEIMPMDAEGEYLLHKVPVVVVERLSGSKELETRVTETLQAYKGLIVRGHGTFAIGKLLEEAYHVTCMIEATCIIRYLVDLTGLASKRDKATQYRTW